MHPSSADAAASGNPFTGSDARTHVDGGFALEEVALANRNSGIPLEALRYDVTPPGLHYLLSHFDIPEVDPAGWRLSLGGCVQSELSLSLAELLQYPSRTLRVTLECAGNGRAGMIPRYPSMPWINEAVSTAEWTGTPLRHLLDLARPTSWATEVAFLGLDRGFDRGVEHQYGRSLELAQARAGDVLLAHSMNGEPLLPQHGHPCRLIVPGWYGMASVKWLSRIDVLDRPFDGFQQAVGYRYRSQEDDPGVPVTTMRVRSLMVPPGVPDWYTRRRLVQAGSVVLRGRAWAGAGVPIEAVEVSVDGEWRAATLAAQTMHRYAWRGWTFPWPATVGEHRLQCRARAADGTVQPMAPEWNTAGMGNNAVQTVQVTVR
ncbi:MAG: sulfite oxidase [Proteobacteria bacterium]|nr:sulfite oxidase [Burkholderiales bacterium]